MVNFPAPTVDPFNPLYCPDLTVASFISAFQSPIHKTTKGAAFQQLQHLLRAKSCSELLSEAALTRESLSPPNNESTVRHPRVIANKHVNFRAWANVIPTLPESGGSEESIPSGMIPYVSSSLLKRKRSPEAFSDICRSAKYARSDDDSISDTSFDISRMHERLEFNQPVPSPYQTHKRNPIAHHVESRVSCLEDALFGPLIGTETPRGIKSLVTSLDRLLPGIRLIERLGPLSHNNHQDIADKLSQNGLLTTRVLELFRSSEIISLSLSASMSNERGLNVSGKDILHVFGKPNSFLFLSELSFSGTPLNDFDLLNIHHLPRLSVLHLSNTVIGNESIFLLTSLKRTLMKLDVSGNPRINDLAIPAILCLAKLSFLSIYDTGVTMVGLRLLAIDFERNNRGIEVDIPTVCDVYISNIHKKYLVQPAPPLICNPEACPLLAVAALKRNLVQHASCNPMICATGTKMEMIERLERILTTRREDLLVRSMILGSDLTEEESL